MEDLQPIIIDSDTILALLLNIKGQVDFIDVTVIRNIIKEKFGTKIIVIKPDFQALSGYFESLSLKNGHYLCKNKELMQYELDVNGVDITKPPYKDILLIFKKYVEDNEFASNKKRNTNTTELEEVLVEFVRSNQFSFKIEDIKKNVESFDINDLVDFIEQGLILNNGTDKYLICFSNDYINCLEKKHENTM